MKVYFSSSLRAKKYHQDIFEKIYKIIKDLCYNHTSDFIIKAKPIKYYKEGQDFAKFYQKLVSQIKKADVAVFEVTMHSLGIGYCVDLALHMGKPVVLLYQKDANPIFFKGIKSDRLQLYEYSSEKDLQQVLKGALEMAKDMIDIRFTFFISPEINRFLAWIAKHKKTPRAVYLRNLIESDMKKYKDFLKHTGQ
jgi:hypothetical protein